MKRANPYYALWHPPYSFWLFWALSLSEYTAVLVFGMYLRAPRQLVTSLRDRVAEAVAAQRVMADQARLAERARIAAEMHDVDRAVARDFPDVYVLDHRFGKDLLVARATQFDAGFDAKVLVGMMATLDASPTARYPCPTARPRPNYERSTRPGDRS